MVMHEKQTAARAQAQRSIAASSRSIASLSEQLDDSFWQAAQWMLDCKGHVLVAGSGTSHHTAARSAHLLSCVGTPALFIHPGDAQHGTAGAIRPEDLLVAISKGGGTAEVNTLARIARERGARVIGVTENPGGELAQRSDLVLVLQSDPEADPFGMMAMGSSLTASAYLDALCVALLELRGYSREAFGATHPGGAVGQRLREEAKDAEA